MIGAASEDAIRLELIVVGRIWDEPYAERCLALASTLGIADQLRFTGSLDPVDVSGELFRGHLAVTALLEGAVASSGSFLAMLAHGLPILAVRTPHDEAQFRDLVAFTSEEPSSMVEAALEIVQSPDGGVALGRRARAHYEREFRWSDIARRARSIALRTAESRYVARA
jgi:glycosyltransferase involved in cell wall biosynthesis